MAFALVRIYPALAAHFYLPLAAILLLYAVRWGQDLTKYGRLASYHATLSRLSGAALFAACAAAFLSFHPIPFFWIAFVIGLVCHLEAMAMTAVLPRWTHDVAGLPAALQLARGARRFP